MKLMGLLFSLFHFLERERQTQTAQRQLYVVELKLQPTVLATVI